MSKCKKCKNKKVVLVHRGEHEVEIPCPACQPIGIQTLKKAGDAFVTPNGETIAVVNEHPAPRKK